MSETEDNNAESQLGQPSVESEGPTTGEMGAPGTEDLATVIAARDRYKEQLLRTAADFDNYRKRARKDVEEAVRRAREDVIRETLSIVDNLERAVAASATATDAQAVAEGVRLVLRSFDDIAQRIGLERIATVGQRFDPTVHDAVQQVESDEPPGTIIAEIVAGYRLDQRLVRPALVVVAKAKPVASA